MKPVEAPTRPTMGEIPTTKRQIVSFGFFKLQPTWNALSQQDKEKSRQDYLELIELAKQDLFVYTYSLVGLRTDVDFLIWQIGWSLDAIQAFNEKCRRSLFGQHLSQAYSLLSMTKRSQYVDKIDPEHQESRLRIMVGSGKYLFVYPFVKKREWYMLSLEDRQKLMDTHIRIGNKYPSVKLHTTYSFGLDDQEFVVAFETDNPEDFLDLVQELREAESSLYTLRDTPIFTCIRKPLKEILESL